MTSAHGIPWLVGYLPCLCASGKWSCQPISWRRPVFWNRYDCDVSDLRQQSTSRLPGLDLKPDYSGMFRSGICSRPAWIHQGTNCWAHGNPTPRGRHTNAIGLQNPGVDAAEKLLCWPNIQSLIIANVAVAFSKFSMHGIRKSKLPNAAAITQYSQVQM